MTIPEVIRSISEILTTAEELLEDGDDRNVALLLTSFLKTLMADLDKLYVEQGPYGTNKDIANMVEQARREAMERATSPGTSEPMTKAAPQLDKTRFPIRNKYAGKCVICGEDQPPGAGFIVPLANPDSKKKWWTYCSEDYRKHQMKEAP